MQSQSSTDSLNTSYSEFSEEKIQEEENDLTVALFDWDDTLFCTCYFEMLQIDCKKIFSEGGSLENYGAYLNYEMQSLERVYIHLNHSKF
jgi:hypothetical protein